MKRSGRDDFNNIQLQVDKKSDEFFSLLAQNMQAALELAKEARTLAINGAYKKGELDADFNIAWYHLWRCEFKDAFNYLNNLPAQYLSIGDEYGYLRAVNSLGVLHLDMGNFDNALPYFTASLEKSRERGEKEREASVLANLGLLYEGMGRIELAYDFFTEALKIPQLNDTGYYTASKCLSLYHIEHGDLDRAELQLMRAIETAEKKNDLHFFSELLVTEGLLHKSRGSFDKAESSFSKGLTISTELGNKKIQAEHAYELGCLAMTMKQNDSAHGFFFQVKSISEKNDIGTFKIRAYKKLSELYEQSKKYEAALSYLKMYIESEKAYNLNQTELRLQSLAFENELEKNQKLAETYRVKSIQLEEENQEILRLANHDSLTGLPNRRMLIEKLKLAADLADKTACRFGVLFIDLNNFKPVNDRFGHRAGDQILISVANRISGVLRQSDIVARYGGDEFVVLLACVQSEDDIHATTNKINLAMEPGFDIAGENLHVGVSIGYSIYPDHDTDVEALLVKADNAMYTVKTKRKCAS
ncbi:diguanylate cyclase [Vibrio hannami]|uniref:GGDEF domain-containing protein n=1 Tax=Vibrio hannami TaxID=2717094 RepID=UPI00240F2482|nr:GGDEF domain-containing protein [Vibrio hannami]MDG3086314.1 diguanylate cyclase [Vibrio hannami]